MPTSRPRPNLTAEQLELWHRVDELWQLSARKDEHRIRDALHPDYMGWDTSAALPHDRDAAVRSVTGDAPGLARYDLEPLDARQGGRRHSARCRRADAAGRIREASRGPTHAVSTRNGLNAHRINIVGWNRRPPG